MTIRTVIHGIGSYLPDKIVTNQDLTSRVETSDEWIRERTGIEQRHFATEGQKTSDLAIAASTEALERAGIKSQDLDLIIVATTTPDYTLPATAAKVQAQLGSPVIPVFDIQAACSGFIYGLSIADSFIKCGQANKVLVVGAETLSRIIDWEDRSTCVLFGDGAGAVVVGKEKGNGSINDRGIHSTHLHADGNLQDLLYSDGGPSSNQTTGFIRMSGQEVFRHAVKNLSETVDEAIKHNNISVDDIDWMVPHQANKRILDSTLKRLGFSSDKVIVTVNNHANTSAASIPLALAHGVDKGLIKEGHLIVMEAMGAGLTWGSALIRY